MLFDQAVPNLLNTEQVAELLGLKPHTLAVARCEGSLKIPYFKIGRSVRYQRSDIEKYLSANRITD